MITAYTNQGARVTVRGLASLSSGPMDVTKGHPIPWTFNDTDAQAFLSSMDHSNDGVLSDYLQFPDPVGVIVHGMAGDPFGDFLVRVKANVQPQVIGGYEGGPVYGLSDFTVTDVTLLPLVDEIQKVPFHSTDESYLHDLYERINAMIAAGQRALTPVGIGIGAGLMVIGLGMLFGRQRTV